MYIKQEGVKRDGGRKQKETSSGKKKEKGWKQYCFKYHPCDCDCSVCGFGVQIIWYFSEYNKGDKEYQKIQDLVINTEKKDDTKEETFSVDFEKLLEMNSDVVGWIRFDEPSEINYPVVQGRDNEEYLKKKRLKQTQIN